jgi:signal transduction histidine kinase
MLLASIAVTAGVAIHAYSRARDQDKVIERVQEGYAKFATWSYEQHLEEVLRNAAREVLGPVDHGSGVHRFAPVPHASEIGHYLPWDEACYCHIPRHGPIPEALLAWTLGSDTVGVGLNRGNRTDGWLIDVPGTPRPIPERQPAAPFAHRFGWVNDTITRHIKARIPSRTGSPYIVAMRDGLPQLLAYRLMPTEWGDTIVYAVNYSDQGLVNLLSAVMDNEDLLPPILTSRHRTRDVLWIDVLTANGAPLFSSDTAFDGTRHETNLSLPSDYGRLRIHAHIRPALASVLVIGGTPRSQMPLLLGLLVLGAAMSLFAAGQLVREGRLARDRTDFVASVSHELRTPLANVRLYLDTLRLGRADTEETREWSLAQMDRETRRLVQLIDNVLLFSSGPRRLLDEPRATLDLASEVAAAIEEFTPLAAARRVHIATQLEPSTNVVAPRTALRHVILNLLDNAVKYGPAGQTVTVRVYVEGDAAVVEVLDQGQGVAPEERERIWRPFVRGKSRAARAVGGSGIGLHLVRELVTGMAGSATVDDAPDGGARFTIRWPRTQDTTPHPIA